MLCLLRLIITIVSVGQLLTCDAFQISSPGRFHRQEVLFLDNASIKNYRKRYDVRLFSIEKPPFIGAALSKDEDLQRTIEIIMKHVDDVAKKQSTSKANNTSSDISDTSSNTLTKIDSNDPKGVIPMDDLSVEKVLSQLTTLFPLFVLSAAIVGMKLPQTMLWVNQGQRVPLMLAAVMMAMGCSLTKDDFKRVLSTSSTDSEDEHDLNNNSSSNNNLTAIPAGVSCQYIIMPLTAYIIGKTMLLPTHPAAFLGLILVGCSPGGTASNLVSLIAKADVALSVILTSISTIMACVVTPLLVKTLVRSAVRISGWSLFQATAQVVLIPVALGMMIREYVPKVADWIGKYASFAGVILVSLLCGGVVAQNASMSIGPGSKSIVKKIITSVIGLHTVGFALGYFVPKKILNLSERVSRTVSIETGMQNSALAVVLARSVMVGDHATTAAVSMACLPGAFSATAHSCLGSALAVFWRVMDARNSKS
jgi:bile acid:Na+ symporter, BASS family